LLAFGASAERETVVQQQIGCRTLGTDGHKPTHKPDQAAHSMALPTDCVFISGQGVYTLS